MKIEKWLNENRKGLILGFVFGAFIAPVLAILGMLTFFEALRPLLIGPMDLLGNLIPNIQTAPNTYYAPFYKWILTLGFNGIVYSALGGIIQSIFKKK
jgi:hypothetical protein